jgi:hypothetical protein
VLSGPRKRTQVSFYGNPTPTAAALKRGGPPLPQETPTSQKITRSSSRRGLAADAEIQTPTLASASRGKKDTPSKSRANANGNGTPTSLPRGTRVSRRFRDVDDEWQQVPEEWLKTPAESETTGKGKARATKGKGKRRGKDADEESELSELTDEEEHQARLAASGTKGDREEGEREEDKGHAVGDETPLTPMESPLPEPKEESKDEDAMEIDGEEPVSAEAETEIQSFSLRCSQAAALETGEAVPQAAASGAPDVEAAGELKDEVMEDPQPEEAEHVDVIVDGEAAQTANGDLEIDAVVDAKPDEEAEVEEKPIDEADIDGEPDEEAEQKEEKPDDDDKHAQAEEEEEEETDEIKLAVKEANNLPEGFVEWEAVGRPVEVITFVL